jgi:hypothetical protein
MEETYRKITIRTSVRVTKMPIMMPTTSPEPGFLPSMGGCDASENGVMGVEEVVVEKTGENAAVDTEAVDADGLREEAGSPRGVTISSQGVIDIHLPRGGRIGVELGAA